MGAPENDEYAHIMSRLEELAAKSYGENEKWDTDAAESDGEEDEKSEVVFFTKTKLKVTVLLIMVLDIKGYC